jgi:HK97 family phage portal protein
MGFADRVIARAAPEQRAITEWGSSAIPGPLGNMAMGGGSYSSVDLRRSEASLQKVAVWSSIDLIAGIASQLPLQTFRSQPDGTGKTIANPKFVDDPGGDDQGTGDWVYQYLGSKLMRGNAYGRPASYDPMTGNPTQIVLLHPDDVKGSRDRYTGVVTWRVNGQDVPASQMWHRRAYPVAGQLLGLSPIGQHATTIGQGISAARFGMQFFSDGGHPSSMLHNTEEEIDQTKATVVKSRFMSTVWGSREPLVMGRGWEYKPLSIAPNESQFLETQKFTGAECCRIFGPNVAEILGYETGGSMTYANQEQRAIDFLKFTLNRWLRDVEAVFTRYLPRPQYVRFDRRVLLETDLLTRYQAHKTARDIGLSNIDELRAAEDMSPLPDGKGQDYAPLLVQIAASRGIDAAQVHAGEPPADQPLGQRSAAPDPKDDDDELDEMSAALLLALSWLDEEAAEERAYDPAKHPHIPKGQPGAGRFMSMAAHIKAAIDDHLKGGGTGDPFQHFDREQLRKAAKARGITLARGEDRDSIAKKLLAHLTPVKPAAVAPSPPAPGSQMGLATPTHIADALSVAYGTHQSGRSHYATMRLKTYGQLTGADFQGLSTPTQQRILAHLQHISTTSKGNNKLKADQLIWRFTPAGTPVGVVPPQPVVIPAKAKSTAIKAATAAGTPGLLKVAKDRGTPGDGWFRLPNGSSGPWGRYGAAGVMLRHVDDKGVERFLMVQRGPGISDPGKWQFPGGAIDSKETPHQGAARETIEELGFKDDALDSAVVHGEHVHSIPGGWAYTSIAATVPTQLQPDLSTHHAQMETSDAQWMTAQEIEKLDQQGKLLSPLARGKLQQNVMSLFPPANPTKSPAAPKPPARHKQSKGRDLLTDRAAIDALRQQIKQDRVKYDGKTADGRLAAIGAMQGYDGTPTVVSKAEMDRLLATGDYIEAWRGVRGAGSYGLSGGNRGGGSVSRSKTAAEINEDMRSGVAYYGQGIFGNGYYLAESKSIARGYADGTPGSLIRVLIPKDALVVDHVDAERQSAAIASPRSKAKGSHEDGTLYDEGRYAAAKGYAGIRIPETSQSRGRGTAYHVATHSKPAWNWLDRSVLIVQER